ncbi:transposase family protein [Leptospira alexanderi]|uniref:transposase family protein n=1 Tax=Leptospira alexanderi TaxID=100053 RepID=UPI001BAFD194|nr:transposase family protein [Leptospira alexanderi]
MRRPTDKDLQKEFYSGKKKRHTIKNLILTNKDKAILFLSNTISGKTHDLKVAENTMITSLFLKMWDASLTLVLKESKRHQRKRILSNRKRNLRKGNLPLHRKQRIQELVKKEFS